MRALAHRHRCPSPPAHPSRPRPQRQQVQVLEGCRRSDGRQTVVRRPLLRQHRRLASAAPMREQEAPEPEPRAAAETAGHCRGALAVPAARRRRSVEAQHRRRRRRRPRTPRRPPRRRPPRRMVATRTVLQAAVLAPGQGALQRRLESLAFRPVPPQPANVTQALCLRCHLMADLLLPDRWICRLLARVRRHFRVSRETESHTS
jgi:hypothetical protein